MNKVFFLEAKCVKHKKLFYPRYDLAADDMWTLTYGLKELPKGQSASRGSLSGGRGERLGPQYKCPWCGKKGFVRCGTCGHISCMEMNSKDFTCAWCGVNGKITGHLTLDEIKDSRRSSGSGQ